MCGINGVILKKSSTKTIFQLQKMNSVIVHRGPDDEGVFEYSEDKYSVAMGMRRLSIIDLQNGNQPFYNHDKSVVIVFNGEIYNFKTIKSELEHQNIIFKTSSDTEVLLKLYETFGVKGFKQLDGMFGFSIFDRKAQKVFIARDYFGEKPMYYTSNQEGLFWSSELKSLLQVIPKPTINTQVLPLYFQLTYIPEPYTIYHNIHKLKANSLLIYNLTNHTYEIETIFPPPSTQKIDISFEEAQTTIFNLLNESVARRSVADVALGTFLSGGVDSSIVSWLLAQQNSTPIHTFSIGFKKKIFDESDKARKVAQLIGSYHNEFVLDENDLSDDLDRVLLNFDEPFADSSALASYIVSKEARKFMKVALTGDGGDEVFGGYNKYMMGRYNRIYTNIFPNALHQPLISFLDKIQKNNDDRGLRFKLQKLLKSVTYDNGFYENIISLAFPKNELHSLFLPEIQFTTSVTSMINELHLSEHFSLTDFRIIDKHISLEGDMLPKVDRTSMLASLETRAPFLTRALWEFTLQLPENFLIKGNQKKYILKKTFENYFPKGFLNKSKHGFGVPVGDWLRSSLREELMSYSELHFLQNQQIFQPEYIQRLVNEHLSATKDHTFKVWTFYIFQKWYKHNVKYFLNIY